MLLLLVCAAILRYWATSHLNFPEGPPPFHYCPSVFLSAPILFEIFLKLLATHQYCRRVTKSKLQPILDLLDGLPSSLIVYQVYKTKRKEKQDLIIRSSRWWWEWGVLQFHRFSVFCQCLILNFLLVLEWCWYWIRSSSLWCWINTCRMRFSTAEWTPIESKMLHEQSWMN